MHRHSVLLFALAFCLAAPAFSLPPSGPGDDITVTVIENRAPCDISPGESVIKINNLNQTVDYRVKVTATSVGPGAGGDCLDNGPDCEVTWNGELFDIEAGGCLNTVKFMPVPGTCLSGSCLGPPGSSCISNDDCDFGESCMSGRCRSSAGYCDGGTSCPSGYSCVDAEGCSPPRGSGCDICPSLCQGTPAADHCVDFGFVEVKVVAQNDGSGWQTLPQPDLVCKNDPARGFSSNPCWEVNCCSTGVCPINACPTP